MITMERQTLGVMGRKRKKCFDYLLDRGCGWMRKPELRIHVCTGTPNSLATLPGPFLLTSSPEHLTRLVPLWLLLPWGSFVSLPSQEQKFHKHKSCMWCTAFFSAARRMPCTEQIIRAT